MAVITRAADVMRTSADSTFEEGAWISNTRFAAIESIPKAGERDGKKDSRAVCFGGIAAEELEGLPWASEPPFPEGPDSCDAQPISNEWADAVGKMDCEKAWHNTCLHV